jgi:hypothetical protein
MAKSRLPLRRLCKLGSKMNAKFDGKCYKCLKTWKKDDPIFYQREPKAVCSDKECFEKYGGKVYEGKPFAGNSFGNKQVSNIDISKINLPEMDKVQTRMTKIADEEALEYFFFRKRMLEHGFSEIQVGMLYKTATDRTR